MSIRIEQAANGYIVHRMGGVLTADEAKRPMVFDNFARLVDWMATHFGERGLKTDREMVDAMFKPPFGLAPLQAKD